MCTCGISRRNLPERLNSMRSPVYRHLRGCPLAVWSCACRGAYVCVDRLTGHEAVAEYAISISESSPRVVCGSQSGHIGVWDINDVAAAATSSGGRSGRATKKRRLSEHKHGARSVGGPSLAARTMLTTGHTGTRRVVAESLWLALACGLTNGCVCFRHRGGDCIGPTQRSCQRVRVRR